jgi:hypothetical protein
MENQISVEIPKNTIYTPKKPTYGELQEELEFYKSLFKTHNNSCVFNLSIKKKNGKNAWVDRIRDSHSYIESLDRDEDIEGWLQPVKPSR